MVGEWTMATLANGPLEIIDGDRGSNYPKQQDFAPTGHCLFLNAGNVTTSGFNFTDCAFISAEKDSALRKGKLRRHDVVLTTRGTVGNVAYFDEAVPYDHIRINSGMVILRAQPEKLRPRFLYLFLRSFLFRSQVESLRTGSAQPQLPIRDINRIEIPVPPLDDQDAIARNLGALDDKIELNRRMNETLETMARALFKSWFVDFDPVRAKAQGRDTGLPKHIADLFPDSFEDSELGEIPKGWNVKPLGDLTKYLSRGIGPSYVEEGGICVLNQKCIRNRRVNFAQSRRHGSAKRSIEGREVRVLDVLINSTGVGTLGRVAQLWHLPEAAIVDSHVTIVRAASDVNPWFLGVGLLLREADIEELGEGSTGQTELSHTRLGALPCVTPPRSLQESFGKTASQLLLRIAENDREAVTLAQLRDTLLPKLISGELRINHPEGAMERVNVLTNPSGLAASRLQK